MISRRTTSSRFAWLAVLAATLFAAATSVTPPAGAQRSQRRAPARAAQGAPAAVPVSAVDDALSVVEPFFGSTVRIPRPYADAKARLQALAAANPKDPRVALHFSRILERLGEFDEAAAAIERYANLTGREPNALRRVAAFYRGRARAADEVRALDELASKLPAGERAPIYRRAIAAINDAKPASLDAAPFYDKLVVLDLDEGNALRDYVTLLLASGDAPRALGAIERVGALPGEKSHTLERTILAEKARVYDRTNRRAEALAVYEQRFDPLWPRAVASDYYGLLSRYGAYRTRRRDLQTRVESDTSMATVSRLFNIYAYEGNLPAAARLLASVEEKRAGAWSREDLDLAASLYAQIGDLDEASRYLYSLYLQGGLVARSPERERTLARLFGALVTADSAATRLAPGGISLYRDVARLDVRPGALNALLSLILAGNNPATEYALEEARAGGYLNRALANTIYEQFAKEYPSSPRLGRMTADLVAALASLGADSEATAVGGSYLSRAAESAEYEEIALAVAEAHARLGDRVKERAVLRTLLDRVASRRPSNRPLVDRSPSRWIYTPDTTDPYVDEESYDDAPSLFVAPNGRAIEASRAGSIASAGGETPHTEYEPTAESWSRGERYEDEENYRGEQISEPRVDYPDLLERMIASYAADEKQNEALAFFWGEVKKHQTDEGLLERFLAWLGSTSLVNDQVRAYRLALDRYEKATWLHRFARWHVRRGRGTEIRRLTDEVLRTLDEKAVTSYIEIFAGYGGTPRGDTLDWDNAIALQVTRLALERFPNNASFARMLLDRLAAAKMWDEWEKVAREHYFADPEIRRGLLERLSKLGALDKMLATARAGAAGGLESGPSTAFAYAVFAADGARWRSQHAEAVAAYRRLVDLYPGEPDYGVPLADLLRSFGSADPANYVASAKVLDELASVHPTERDYATKAGEALASAGDMGEAAKRWRSLVAVAPGSPAVRLEVATIFWDYFLFDEAADEIVALREAANDPSLYAYRLGAIYDSKRDLDRAIPEYVKTLAETGSEAENARTRLAELSRRDGVLARIERAYAAERAKLAEPWRLALGYADLLRAIGRNADAVAVLDREAAVSHDIAFLEEARDRFHSWRDADGEVRALERIAVEARDERERIRARLQLAALYAEQDRDADATKLFEQLVAENPTNVGVLQEATRFLWSTGSADRAISLSRDVISRARGDYRKSFTLELARRETAANRLDDAEATLRAYYQENPLDAEVFSELAALLGRAKKGEALAALYRETLERVRSGEIPEEERVARIADLRRGMIATLEALGRHTEAVDQHIEIVNREPESVEALDAAFDYASRHDLTPRLVAYYEKLTNDAAKNYRWSLVLGRLYERTGNAAGSAEAFRRTVANEPQRVDLHVAYATALERAGRDDDAVAELRRTWEIDARNPEWLLQVARIRAREGRMDEAGRAVDEALAARSNVKAAMLFVSASRLESWNMLEKSVDLYERGFAASRLAPADSYVASATVADYARVASRVRPVAEVFAKLESLRSEFAADARIPDSFTAGSASSHAEAFATAERDSFGQIALEYGSSDELQALERAVVAAAGDQSFVDDKRLYLAIARGAGLLGGEEAIQTSIVEILLAEIEPGKEEPFRGAVRDLVDVYTRRAMFARAAERLAAYRDRDPRPGDYGYDQRIAELYRRAGDVQNEIAALERIYATASGAILDDGGEQSAAVRRLFELLVASGQRDRIVALAARQSPYQLVLVNFLVAQGDEETARRAIASAAVSPAWVRAKTAELGLYFRDASPAVEASFRGALHASPIGELVGAPRAEGEWLDEEAYFLTARNYGIWLDLVANRAGDSRDWIVGRVEDRPHDAAAQAQLGRYYLARERFDRALAHADLAVELDASDVSAVALRGEALFGLGRTDEAVATWTSLVDRRDAGAVELQVYFAEMSSHDRLAAALGRLRPLVSSFAARDRFGAVAPLLADMAAFAAASSSSSDAIADALYGAAVDAPDEIQIALTVLRDDLVPSARRTPFYRLLIDRLATLDAALSSDPYGDSYVILGGDYFSPSEELNTWRRRAADHLIATGAYDEARALVDALEAERGDDPARIRGDEGGEDYSWIYLARATLEARAGRPAEAMAAAERYCGGAVDRGIAPDAERCVAAASVLRANGAPAEADAMLETAYRATAESSGASDASVVGLADVLYRRGKTAEADAVLTRLAARRADSAPALTSAADAAARGGRYALAVSLRESAARIARGDATNALELARARAAAGDRERAASDLAAIVGDERAASSIRAEAIDVAVELARGDAAARAVVAKAASGGRSEHERILAALVSTDPRGALSSIASTSRLPIAALELGRVELEAGRRGEATAAFERALAVDPDSSLSGALAFAGPTPVDALVRLYAENNRPAAALALASPSSYPTSEGSTALAFDPRPDAGESQLATIAARNAAARTIARASTYAALADAAAALGEYDAAVGYARARVALLAGATPERATAEARVSEIQAASLAAARRAASLLRVGTAVTTEAVAIRDFTIE